MFVRLYILLLLSCSNSLIDVVSHIDNDGTSIVKTLAVRQIRKICCGEISCQNNVTSLVFLVHNFEIRSYSAIGWSGLTRGLQSGPG